MSFLVIAAQRGRHCQKSAKNIVLARKSLALTDESVLQDTHLVSFFLRRSSMQRRRQFVALTLVEVTKFTTVRITVRLNGHITVSLTN